MINQVLDVVLKSFFERGCGAWKSTWLLSVWPTSSFLVGIAKSWLSFDGNKDPKLSKVNDKARSSTKGSVARLAFLGHMMPPRVLARNFSGSTNGSFKKLFWDLVMFFLSIYISKMQDIESLSDLDNM